MQYKQFWLTALALVSATNALHRHERHVDDLEARAAATPSSSDGSYKFEPSTQEAEGDTCAAAFGVGYETCREASAGTNRLCYNPVAGQACCSASWSCPNGSFCMTNGACCPNGMQASDCIATASVAVSTKASKTSTSSATSKTTTLAYITASANSTSSHAHTYASAANASSTTHTIALAAVSSTLASASSATITGAAAQATLGTIGLIGAGLFAMLASF